MRYPYLINAVLIAVTVFVATVATTATHAEDSARNRPFASKELQAAIMNFADNWASQIVEATTLLVKRVTMSEVRHEPTDSGIMPWPRPIISPPGPTQELHSWTC